MTDPKIRMAYSDDGAYNFNNWRERSLGGVGEFLKRIIWRRLGSTRHRTYAFEVTDDVKVTLISASVE